ncbi:MAG: hypothetical protein U0X91_04620 [Spirosomataceae bacterium]
MPTETKKWVGGVAGAAAIPLLLWLLAVWQWKPGAFVLAFTLLSGGVGLLYEAVTKKKMVQRTYRFAVVSVLAAVFALVWMNVAVGGILGDNPANRMYFGVLLVGLIGAFMARLEAQPMSYTLFAMAFAMVSVPAIALFIGTPAFTNGVAAVFGLHVGFALPFIGSALLFRRAARELSDATRAI